MGWICLTTECSDLFAELSSPLRLVTKVEKYFIELKKFSHIALMNVRLGIDLGGTKIEIVALDDNHTQLMRRRVPTPQGDYQGTLMKIVELVDDAERQLGRRGSLGVGIPGAEARFSGLVKNANSTCLIGQPFRKDLQELLRRNVRVANDANCFALSEATDGAAASVPVVFGVILGTGVGGGISVNRSVLTGANRISGEWGHNRQPGEIGRAHV